MATKLAHETGLARVLLLVLALLCAGAPASAHQRDEQFCRLTVLGDSLAAGYGVDVEDAFPAQLEDALRAEGFPCEVINAGVSGDTSAGGLARVNWVLSAEPSHLLVELGGNDGLRALPPEQLRRNLNAIVEQAKERDVPVFLAGIQAPPNLGEEYTEAFNQSFKKVAERHDIPLYPFFLDGAYGRPERMQEDGIHPNAEGVSEIVKRILPSVTVWLKETGLSSVSSSL